MHFLESSFTEFIHLLPTVLARATATVNRLARTTSVNHSSSDFTWVAGPYIVCKNICARDSTYIVKTKSRGCVW